MVFVHVEVVTSENVSSSSSVDAVQVYAIVRSFSMSYDLLISSNVLRFKTTRLSSGSEGNFANMRCVRAAKCRNFAMKNVSKRSF